MDEFNARYNKLSGGSKQAFDYLQGKADYTPVPYTKDKKIMKPYSESVLGIPQSIPDTQKYYVDSNTGKLTLNKNYSASGSNVKKALENSVSEDTPVLGTTTPADFDSEAYLKAHPDVAAELANGKASYGSAYGHYLLYGAQGSKIKDPAYAYTTKPTKANSGGIMSMAHGGGAHPSFFSKATGKFNFHAPKIYADGGSTDEYNLGSYSDGGRLLRGPGDGVSDSIPATIGKGQPARLADGEFVVPARIVSELGNGSTEAGAKQLYAMMDRIQKARSRTVGKGRVATNTKASKYLPA